MRSVAEAARAVLAAADPRDKVMAARAAARGWRMGRLAHDFDVAMPDRPARPAEPELLPPNRMPKRGKAGSERSRIALIHALAHIEFVAIDLAFDMAGRFGAHFPRAFVDDWFGVGADEAMHFALLDRRLKQLGSRYGALPAHDGLWDAATATAHDVLARLAIVPMVLEARGLDVTPSTIDRLSAVGDAASARILTRILNDEVRHVRAGTYWFESGCARESFVPETKWRELVERHFRGLVKPPFNDSARDSAGLTRDYYQPLAAQ
ncbi:ferritin-like domain-containing protein [Sphingomonas sp.]|uniref:ferritin-like domain-containing protein n=1 Tax=Sphingomonas sp. TaxID=28214 RepID=UPI001B1B6D3D|nr:ferritin-like domain-containing protein [Sphingomonas sp.]MBO9714306.1 ferritin-like domain-containing protein [Sphingomonas sp.]